MNSLLAKYSGRAKGGTIGPPLSRIDAFCKRHVHACQSKSFATTMTSVDMNAAQAGKVVLCFIIIDKLPHEHLWRYWLAASKSSTKSDSSEDPENICILIHAKYPEKVESEWVRARLVRSFQFCPHWASLDVSKTMVGLMKEALTLSAEVSKIMFVSETCIPVVPREVALAQLLCDSCSWVDFGNEGVDGFHYQKQWEPVENKGFTKGCVYKSSQWVVLSRQHAQEILALPPQLLPPQELCRGPEDYSARNRSVNRVSSSVAAFDSNHVENSLLEKVFCGINATDEVYLPSCLCILGHLPPLRPLGKRLVAAPPTGSGSNSGAGASGCRSAVHLRACTYSQWPAGGEPQHPTSYASLTESDLRNARVYNHPALNTCALATHIHYKPGNPLYPGLKAVQRLGDYAHSTLLMRKMRPETAADCTQMFKDWRRMVMDSYYGAERSPADGTVSASSSGCAAAAGVLTVGMKAGNSASAFCSRNRDGADDGAAASGARKRRREEEEEAALSM